MNINNEGYGQTGCIIFRPDNIVYRSGDQFHVEITGSGSTIAEYDVNFFSIKPAESFEIPETAVLPLNGKKKLQKTILPADVSNKNPIWTSSDPEVCTVDDEGVITSVGKLGDTAQITAVLDGIERTCQITIGESLEGATAKLTPNETAKRFYWDDTFNYTGKEVKPSATVTLSSGDVLEEGIDYTIYYENNIASNMWFNPENGKWNSYSNVYSTAIISGCGKYGGDIELPFKIRTTEINDSAVTVLVSTESYNGTKLTPSITVKYGEKTEGTDDDWTLVEGTDYEIVSYDNNVNASKSASVTIKGLNGFYSTRNVVFEILPADISGASAKEIPDQAYATTAPTPEPEVTFGGMSLVKGTDYELSYKDNDKAGAAFAIFTGTGNYTGEKEIPFIVNPEDLSKCIQGTILDQTYTGTAIEPDIPLTDQDGEYPLVKDADYTVTFEQNVDAGEKDAAVATVTGTGNYSGKLVYNFTILPVELTALQGLESLTYNAKNQTLADLTVLAGDVKAGTEDTDYTVSYKNNRDAGTAQVTVTGSGNFTGTVEDTFTINPAQMQDYCKVEASALTFNGTEQSAAITVTGIDGELLSADAYALSGHTSGTDAGDYPFTVTAKDNTNYTGSIDGTFTIEPASLASYNVQTDAQTYTGTVLTPAVRVLQGENALIADQDYTVAMEGEAKKAGTYTVTVTGKGNYKDTAYGTFTIEKESMENVSVALANAAATCSYTGSEICPEVQATLNGITLPQEDYTVAYASNIAAGDRAEITVSAAKGGSLTGAAAPLTFGIAPADLTGASVQLGLLEGGYTYDGKAYTPDVVSVQLDGVVSPGSDEYTVDYQNNVDAGTATVLLTGKGNFTGTAKTTFGIAQREIGTAIVTADDATYTGAPVETNVTVSLDGIELQSGQDYSVSYPDADYTKVGQVTVRVTGKGNYTGFADQTFAIRAADLSNAVVSAADQTYTGTELTPPVTVTLNGVTLPAADYTVEYANNTAVGTATITVTPSENGNLTGDSVTGSFRINEKPSGGSGSNGGGGSNNGNGANAGGGDGAAAAQNAPGITIPKTVKSLKAKARGKKVTVTWKKDKKTIRKQKIQGYEIRVTATPNPEDVIFQKRLGKGKAKFTFKPGKGTWHVWIRYFRADGVSNWKHKKVKVKK